MMEVGGMTAGDVLHVVVRRPELKAVPEASFGSQIERLLPIRDPQEWVSVPAPCEKKAFRREPRTGIQ